MLCLKEHKDFYLGFIPRVISTVPSGLGVGCLSPGMMTFQNKKQNPVEKKGQKITEAGIYALRKQFELQTTLGITDTIINREEKENKDGLALYI